ncbi:MAG TPA: hypothetical protein VFK49_04225 [Stellaceae bacterium]|nr:hypothetical protein [Stellaceae bacterium]
MTNRGGSGAGADAAAAGDGALAAGPAKDHWSGRNPDADAAPFVYRTLARASAFAVSLEAAEPAEDVPSSVEGAASFKPSKPEDKLARLSLFTAGYPSALACATSVVGDVTILLRFFCADYGRDARGHTGFLQKILRNYGRIFLTT